MGGVTATGRIQYYSFQTVCQILLEARLGGNIASICHKYGISKRTYHRWSKQYADLSSYVSTTAIGKTKSRIRGYLGGYHKAE